jgi:protein-disulfide isomerase
MMEEHILLAKDAGLRLMSMFRLVSGALMVALMGGVACVPAGAQTSVGADSRNPATQFKDTSMLKPPAGVKVAIVEWEDLECPACAHAFPIVHAEAKQYGIPIVRYDFPLKMHVWSHDAAIIARYIQDKISPDAAEEYRREVFASQFQIASKDDLQRFTQKFFSSHGRQLPFVIDPTGQFAREVEADTALGDRAGLSHTPTIVVVSPHHWIEVLDVSELTKAIDQAKADEAQVAAHHATTAHR